MCTKLSWAIHPCLQCVRSLSTLLCRNKTHPGATIQVHHRWQPIFHSHCPTTLSSVPDDVTSPKSLPSFPKSFKTSVYTIVFCLLLQTYTLAVDLAVTVSLPVLVTVPSVWPGVDPNVQAVSQQVTVSHPPGARLPLLSARPASLPRKHSPDGVTTD